MKILIINAADIMGGSALAAYRLSKGLQKYHGVESYFLVGVKRTADKNIFCTRRSQNEYYFEFALDRITNALGLQYQWFPFSSKTILKNAKELGPDLIYLRNIHGGYFQISLIKKLSQIAPIAWTLSDMWSFTGNCAHTFGDESWKYIKGCRDNKIYPAIGINTGRWLLKQKKRIYNKSEFTVITPSKWLFNLARQSPVFKDKEIIHIYNGFDLEIFRQKDKVACRTALDIPHDAKVLMFSADFLADNPWKGGKDLLNILKIINSNIDNEIHLLVVGSGDLGGVESFDKLIVHKTGHLQSDVLMSICYSAADIFIYPVKAETLGSVMIESIACSTPCIVFDVGGCGEIIKDGICGYVIKPFDTEKFAERTLGLLNNDDRLQEMSRDARNIAEERFSLKRMSDDYYDCFRRITGKV